MTRRSPQKIVLTSCRRWPQVSESDAALVDVLTRRGHTVLVLPWNDAPLADFAAADKVVLRSNWDFHHDLEAFEKWLISMEERDIELHNRAGVIRPYLQKGYVCEMAAAGIAAPLTLAPDQFDVQAIVGWMDSRDFDRVVIKPRWGASGHNVKLLTRNDLLSDGGFWALQYDSRPVLVQEYIPQISQGEYSLVFFGGEFSHAFRRLPRADEFRVNSQYGGTVIAVQNVDREMIEFGAKVVDTFPEPATYARIDVVWREVGATLMEIEVNEPALGLDLVPDAADRFADALFA